MSNVTKLVKDIDARIATLQAELTQLESAKAALSGIAPSKRGRKPSILAKAKPKREMSPEARQRIAAAQKKRWAAQKKAAKAS